MAKNVTNKNRVAGQTKPRQSPSSLPSTKTISPNALRDRNWGVLFVAFVFVLSLVATFAVMLLTISTRLDVIPAALLMVAVELWLIVYVPLYSRLAFWGGIIFIISFLFFAVPFVVLNLFPPYNAYAVAFILVSLASFVIMFRERAHFLYQKTITTSRSN